MQIPQYWAQKRMRHQSGMRHGISVQRWGWSDLSESDAEAHAEQRAQQALEAVLNGQQEFHFERMEWQSEYGLGGSTPIREEILERRGQAVLTRNSYGAHCLNTEQVAIADIDYPQEKKRPRFPIISALLFAAALPWLWVTPLSWSPGLVALLLVIASVGLIFWSGLQRWFASRQQQRSLPSAPTQAEAALAKVRAFAAAHPDWGLRVYETPKGLRVIVSHAALRPESAEAQTLFTQLEVDPLYALLCQKQKCFRARVSGKPWRMALSGLSTSERRWPIPKEHQVSRQQWVDRYESAAQKFAACRFLEQHGPSLFCTEAQAFIHWHDEASKAHSTYSLA